MFQKADHLLTPEQLKVCLEQRAARKIEKDKLTAMPAWKVAVEAGFKETVWSDFFGIEILVTKEGRELSYYIASTKDGIFDQWAVKHPPNADLDFSEVYVIVFDMLDGEGVGWLESTQGMTFEAAIQNVLARI